MAKPFPAGAVAGLSPEAVALLQRGHAGDLTAMPEVRRLFDESPELAEALGDLASHAEEALVRLVAGPSLTGAEAVRRHLQSLEDELLAEASSPLERLLVRRVVLCEAWVCQAELDLAGRLASGDDASPSCKEAVRRLDAACRRLCAAGKALGWARKLLARRPPSPLELLAHAATEKKRKAEAGPAGQLAGRLDGVLN